MESISNKALIIAVSLIVTMAIASSVLYTINQVKRVYKQVYETDVSIQSSFRDFDAYDGAVKTKLEWYNTAKKYQDNKRVYVIEGIGEEEVKEWDNGGINSILSKALLKRSDLSQIDIFIANNANTGDSSKIDPVKAADKYNTFVYYFDNDKRVIIGFNKI